MGAEPHISADCDRLSLVPLCANRYIGYRKPVITANYIAISSNQRIASDPDRLPSPQIGVSANKHISSRNHRRFAVSLGRTPYGTFALDDGAGAKLEPPNHVSAPS